MLNWIVLKDRLRYSEEFCKEFLSLRLQWKITYRKKWNNPYIKFVHVLKLTNNWEKGIVSGQELR